MQYKTCHFNHHQDLSISKLRTWRLWNTQDQQLIEPPKTQTKTWVNCCPFCQPVGGPRPSVPPTNGWSHRCSGHHRLDELGFLTTLCGVLRCSRLPPANRPQPHPVDGKQKSMAESCSSWGTGSWNPYYLQGFGIHPRWWSQDFWTINSMMDGWLCWWYF